MFSRPSRFASESLADIARRRTYARAPFGKYLRQGVVIAEVTLSFVLLIGSGLMLRSFVALEHVDPGLDPKGVLTFTAFNPRTRTPGEAQAYANNLERRLAAIPGVTSVTAATPLPLDGQDQNMRWGPVAAQTDPSLFQQATLHSVRPNFFEAMRVRFIAGRTFNAAENDTGSHALIIDRDLAAKAFPGQTPQSIVGKQMFCRITTPEAQMYQVIGVVEHVRHLTLTSAGREGAFVPDGSFGFFVNRWAVRTSGEPTRLIPEVRRAVADVDALVPIGEMQPMSEFVDRAMAPTRFSLVLIAVFAVVAAVLAAVGLYGVLSTTVRQRTAEIGVRMAFGATSDSIFRLMIGQGMILSAIGIVVGLAAALALTGVMQKANMLVSIKPTDPVTYASIAALFAIIASLACLCPPDARLDSIRTWHFERNNSWVSINTMSLRTNFRRRLVTFARMIASLTEEAEAIGWYEQRLAVEKNKSAAAIMRNAQHEEMKHFGMDLEFLLRQTPKWRETLKGILFKAGDIVKHADAAEEASE